MRLRWCISSAATIPVVAADENYLIDAMDAVVGHGLSFWDAMCGRPLGVLAPGCC